MHRTRRDTDPSPLATVTPATAPAGTRTGAGLYGRHAEGRALDRLLTNVRAGRSQVLIVRGESGAGKTALLEQLIAAASDLQVVRAVGVESETGLLFSGLHQLCAPMLSRAERLPAPQRDALRYVSGVVPGPPADEFQLGLAVLGLLAEAAEERPLICVFDDEVWLDRASMRVLGFAARRLAAGSVGLVFASRRPGAELAGLPELRVGRLRDGDSRALLASALIGPLDAQVRDLLVAETRGNPRALLELPRGLSPAELAGGFGLADAAPPTDEVDDEVTRQLAALPEQARRLVQLAAADPSGDRRLLWQAAGRLGIPAQAAAPAVEAGLMDIGTQVRFSHPLARSAVYSSVPHRDRQAMHAALADATDPSADPDRRAWHRAHACAGPDDDVAAELERWAGTAQARGGLAAAAAFLEQSVLLTTDPARYAGRALAAARAGLRTGAFDKALHLLAIAKAGRLDELAGGRADLVRGQLAVASDPTHDAPSLLLEAAQRLEPLDVRAAREAQLSAWTAALVTGRPEALLAASRAARALPPTAPPRPADLVLDGLALIVTDGPAAAAPALRRALGALGDADLTAEGAVCWGWPVQVAAGILWDHDVAPAVLLRQVQLARAAGALSELPFLLDALGAAVAAAGEFAAASALVVEADMICAVTGASTTRLTAMMLSALRGHEAAPAETDATGPGIAVACSHWAAALLHNGLGRYEEALTAAGRAGEDGTAPHISMWALPELVEAAVRAGQAGLARDALKQLAEVTQSAAGDAALGIEARCRALLSHGGDADDRYRESIDRLGRAGLRPALARAHLLYGEWLRREGRRLDAREQLRTAYDLLTAIGMAAFAERARRELTATGEVIRKRGVGVSGLTAQEAVIARLAGDGRTNPEIGAELFLSARTIEWHLRKVFTKLDISSRRDLRVVLERAA